MLFWLHSVVFFKAKPYFKDELSTIHIVIPYPKFAFEKVNIEYNDFEEEPTLIVFDEKSKEWESSEILDNF